MTETLSPEVVAVLVDRHRRFLQFLESRVGNRAVAEELLQAAFVKAVEHGSQLREGESAVAWFYRLLRNALVDFYRARDAEQRAMARHATEAPATTERDPALDAAVCECVHGLIPTLKPDYADVLRAVEIEGQGVADVARRLGITPGNAAVRLHRARLALKSRLEASCGSCTDHGCLDCTCKAKSL
jgi:RNA polymerase sigma factor (sigma-70 family)